MYIALVVISCYIANYKIRLFEVQKKSSEIEADHRDTNHVSSGLRPNDCMTSTSPKTNATVSVKRYQAIFNNTATKWHSEFSCTLSNIIRQY